MGKAYMIIGNDDKFGSWRNIRIHRCTVVGRRRFQTVDWVMLVRPRWVHGLWHDIQSPSSCGDTDILYVFCMPAGALMLQAFRFLLKHFAADRCTNMGFLST